jgi:hypothetical protein
MKTSYSSRRKILGFVASGPLANLAVGGLIVLGAGSIGLFHSHDLAALAAFPSLDSQDQNAGSIIAQDIRCARCVDSRNTNEIAFRESGSTGVSTITYNFDTESHTLTRTDSQGGAQVLLNGVEAFSFSLFQRPGANAAYGTFAPANASDAKVVGCHWTCSRKVAGEKVNSQTVEIAPIVLRNRG